MSLVVLGAFICVMMAEGAFTINVNGSESQVDEKQIEPGKRMIFPGTKWCGVGNIAWYYSQLGIYYKTDLCCREHDQCPQVIEPGQTKYNLTNHNVFLRLSCDCDNVFLRCLRNVGTMASFMVRKVYFNVQTQCFKLDYPIVKCNSYYPMTKRCQDYTLNTKAPKLYQWFDLTLS